MNTAGQAATTIVIGVIGVGIVAVIVSNKSQASALIQSFGSALTSALQIAEQPITANQGVATPTTGAGTTGGLLNNNVVTSQLSAPLLSDPIGSGVTSSQFSQFLADNGILQEQPITVELPGIGQTQTGTANFTVSP
jgi:hypothetical protein